MSQRYPQRPDRSRQAAKPGRPLRGMWLSDLAIRQPVFIAMLAIAALVVGAVFYSRMPLELFPDVSLPVAVVQTVYPGVSPEEVERSITQPIEDAVSSINGVETVRSTSTEGVSLVVVEFAMSRDGKEAADDVRTRVSAIRNTLPAESQEPVVLRFDFSDAPVVSIAIADASGQRSAEQLRTFAEDVVKARLQSLDGVAAVDVVGGATREVHVDLDRTQLEKHGVAPQQVVQAIRSENLDVPAGSVPDGTQDDLLRTAGRVRSLGELGDVPVASRPGGVTIRVKNVASISEGVAESRAHSRLDGKDSVVASVRKQSGSNTVRVADATKTEVARLQQEYPDLSFAVAFDSSTYTRQSVQDVQASLVLGGLLAALVVLLFFRDIRNTLVTVVGLPVVLLATFAVMHVLGVSLNMVSLLALSVCIGMLIDDAIVVRENIFRHTEAGEEPRVAASRGTAEIALAVVAVTSTIVAVFLPIAFTEGLAGKFLRDFGITVAAAVLVSLVEAFTLAPMLSAHFFRKEGTLTPSPSPAQRERGAGVGGEDSLSGLTGQLARGYRRLLGWSLRHRALTLLVGVLALAGAGAIVPHLTVAFSPQADQGTFGIALELPPGTRLDEADRVTRAVEDALRATPDVEHVFTTVGSADAIGGADNTATLNVQLRERGRTDAFVAGIRPDLERAANGARLTLDLQANNAIFGSGAAVGAVRGRPIQFSVQGDDPAALDRVSGELVARLKQVSGLVDVDRSLKPGQPGQDITVDRQKVADQGLTTGQVAATVRSLVNGERAGSYRSGDRDLDVVVRLAEPDRDSLAEVLQLPIVTPKGTHVQLSELASAAETTEPSQIDREDRQRQVIVGAGYQGNPGAALTGARRVAAGLDLPAGVTVKVSGQAKSQDEMLASLGLALGLSVLFVYMVLASQFGSFLQPLTVMLALPFSGLGALIALYAFGFSLDMLGIIGIILLMGLVAKNSILLVEFANQLRRQGLGAREAMLEAGPVRLRPILMTTLAMVFGMAPVAAGLGAGAELRQPLGVSVVGGLVTSTLLTLVVVPVAYTLAADLAGLVCPHPQPLSRRAREDCPTPGEGRSGALTPILSQGEREEGAPASALSQGAQGDSANDALPAPGSPFPPGVRGAGSDGKPPPVGKVRDKGSRPSGPFTLRRIAAGAAILALVTGALAYSASPGSGLLARPAAGTPAPEPTALAGTTPVTPVPATWPVPEDRPEPGVALAVIDPAPPPAPPMPPVPPVPVMPATPNSPAAPPQSMPQTAPSPAASPTPGSDTNPAPVTTRPPGGSQLAVANTNGLGAYVREAPVTGSPGIVAWPEGTALSPLGEAQEQGGRTWVRVQDPKGTVGWVPKEYLSGKVGG